MTITVVGLVPETVQLPDIGLDVPHGVVVHISAERANNSKDLWRAISQRRVFRLQAGPFTPNVTPPVVVQDPEIDQLRARVVVLEAENQALRAELGKKNAGQSQLDEILRLLQQGGGSPQAPGVAPARAAPLPSGVVEIETPTFIPASIKGDGPQTQVEIEETASGGEGVSGARSALRKLRRGE